MCVVLLGIFYIICFLYITPGGVRGKERDHCCCLSCIFCFPPSGGNDEVDMWVGKESYLYELKCYDFIFAYCFEWWDCEVRYADDCG